MKKSVQKRITKKTDIEGLAIMVAKGFVSMEKNFSDRFTNIDNKLSRFENAFTALSNRVDGLHEDVVHIKTTLGPLARMAGAQDKEIESLKLRVTKLEAKLR